MRAGRWLVVSLLISCAAWAEVSPPLPQTLEEAGAQRQRAASMRAEAERRYETEQKNCYTKFMVNDCLAAAKKHYTAAIIEARQLDQPARDFERALKRQEVEAKEAQRLADQPRREAGQQESAERFRAEEAAQAAAREQKLATKAAKAEEGHRKEAARQAKRQAKLEKRAQQETEREARQAARDAGKPAGGATAD